MHVFEYYIRITACALPSVPYIHIPCHCLVRSYPVASKIWNCTKVPGMRSLEFASRLSDFSMQMTMVCTNMHQQMLNTNWKS